MKFDPSIKKDLRLTARIQKLRENKTKIIQAVRNKLIAKKSKKSNNKEEEKKEGKTKTKK